MADPRPSDDVTRIFNALAVDYSTLQLRYDALEASHERLLAACKALIEYADCDEPTDEGDFDARDPDMLLDQAEALARTAIAAAAEEVTP